MEQVIKTYLGIFLMMLLSTVGIGIVAAEAQICQARNFKSDVVVELENSNYNREVINACIKQADELGYQLTTYGGERQPLLPRYNQPNKQA